MKWTPTHPITSSISNRVSAHDYGTDLAIENGDLVFENGDFKTTKGINTFLQMVQTALLTESELLPNGLFAKLPISNNELTFREQCEKISFDLVEDSFIDPLTKKEEGLGKTIEEIISIEKNQNKLIFEMKLTGEPSPVLISIPVPSS